MERHLEGIDSGRPRAWGRKLGQLGIIGALLAILVLAFWPVSTSGTEGSESEARECRRKLADLAWKAKRGEAGSGTLTEREVNAHLERILADNPQARNPQGLTVALESLRVDLEPGRAKLFIRGSVLRLPLVFEGRFDGTSEVEECLHLESLRLGRLPLVGPFKSLVVRQMRHGLLAQLRSERTVLESLSRVELSEEEAHLSLSVG